MKTDAALMENTPLNELSRQTMLAHGEHFFFSNWRKVVFFHYAVDPEYLQPHVPFELDLYEGKAYVSGVAFYLENLRPTFGGVLSAALMRPIANHEFLNIRTYVRHKGETGIYFLAEFLPNLLSAQLGPPFCGLPYRHAKVAYQNEPHGKEVAGHVALGKTSLTYRGTFDPDPRYSTSAEGSLEEFLLERYTAFTWRKGIVRYFRVWHPPWRYTRLNLEVKENGLLTTTGDWLGRADLVGGHYSEGFNDIWMGRPRRFLAR